MIYIYRLHSHTHKYIYIFLTIFFRPRSMNGFSNRPGFWSRIFDIFRGKGVAIRSHLELLTSLSKWYDWYDPNAEWLEGITLKMAYFHLFPVFSQFWDFFDLVNHRKKKSRVYPTKQRALSPGWQEVSAMCRLRRAARLIHEGLEGLEASSYQESYLTHVSIFVDGWWLWADPSTGIRKMLDHRAYTAQNPLNRTWVVRSGSNFLITEWILSSKPFMTMVTLW